MITIIRKVVAVSDDGERTKKVFKEELGEGVLYTDTLTYDLVYGDLSFHEQTSLGLSIRQENDELLSRLFRVEMEVMEE